MVREEVERELYNAASRGDLPTLQQLLQQDPYLVDGVSFSCSRNLLHIATVFGHLGIVEELLKINPRLARIPDSQKSSPLHIAAAEGHVEIAKKLIAMAPEMCQWRDDQGMNPVHVAAMNGHVEVLEHLLEEGPLPAMERVYRGETVLHLCVKYSQLGALKVLMDKLGELVNASDDDGETILHMAVRSNQLEIIRYLVESNKMKRRTWNSMGKTPLQILDESSPGGANYSEIKTLLVRLLGPPLVKILLKQTDMTMVVVVLIATMAFQAVVSPPGGVWQDDTSSHRSGDAVMASTHPSVYTLFLRANTIAFLTSILTIVLITTLGPSADPRLMVIVVYAMGVSLAAIAVSYGASAMVITPNTETRSPALIVVIVVTLSLSIFVLGVVYAVIWSYCMWRRRRKRFQQEVTSAPPIPRFLYWIQQLETH